MIIVIKYRQIPNRATIRNAIPAKKQIIERTFSIVRSTAFFLMWINMIAPD
ncbi:MAG: hypothetical protein IKY66_07345 [Bacteroidales bacterium]|nr:hypothetical protein [Bacteroidales bacterium]